MPTNDALRMTLPAKVYVDADYFQEEMERIFFTRWISVGRANDVPRPGDYFTRELGKESLIVTRDEQGKIHALFNVCRHRGTRLCDEEKGNFKGRIVCPYHAWTYALDGRLTGAPQMAEVTGFSAENFPLHKVAAEVWDGSIWVSFAERPISLREQLGGAYEKFRNWRPEELERGKRIVYEVKANWKLLIQNYSECLHCPVIHPALKKLTHYMSGDNEPVSSAFLGGTMTLNDGIKTMTCTGDSSRAVFTGLTPEQRRLVYYYWISPNVLLSYHPDYLVSYLLLPKRPDLTEVVCDFLFHPSEMKKPGFTADDAADLWDQVNREDWRVSELSQLGISSRAYSPGPYSNRELLLHGLDHVLTGGHAD
jgi:Rieske 2Fe-2S family protein